MTDDAARMARALDQAKRTHHALWARSLAEAIGSALTTGGDDLLRALLATPVAERAQFWSDTLVHHMEPVIGRLQETIVERVRFEMNKEEM
jgi:hypothetical protein